MGLGSSATEGSTGEWESPDLVTRRPGLERCLRVLEGRGLADERLSVCEQEASARPSAGPSGSGMLQGGGRAGKTRLEGDDAVSVPGWKRK